MLFHLAFGVFALVVSEVGAHQPARVCGAVNDNGGPHVGGVVRDLVVNLLGTESVDMLSSEHQSAVLGHQSAELAGQIADLAGAPVACLVHVGVAGICVALVNSATNLGALVGMVLRRP